MENKGYVAMNRRYYESIRYAKQFIGNKDTTFAEMILYDNPKKFLSTNKQGSINDFCRYQLVHYLDILEFILGKITRVEGTANKGWYQCKIIHENKRSTSLRHMPFHAGNDSLEIYLSCGETLVLKPFENLKIYKEIGMEYSDSEKRTIYTPRIAKVVESDFECKPGLKELLRDFLKESVEGLPSVANHIELYSKLDIIGEYLERAIHNA